MPLAFTDHFYDFQTLRTVCPLVGAPQQEVCTVAERVREGDSQSWYAAWKQASDRALAEGKLLKASHYSRTAAFMLPDTDPQSLQAHRQARALFQRALEQEPHAIKFVAIPYEGMTLPGYLGLVEKGAPLLLLHSGFDGTAEEIYMTFGRAALARGYNVLIFEGPGQGAALREQGLTFRPDWEAVVTPVVDYALTLEGVDPHKLALVGFSMGGYLAPRALAFERRIPVGVVNGGVYDQHAVVMSSAGDELEPLLDIPEACEMIDQETARLMEKTSSIRWAVEHGMFAFGATTPSEWLRLTRDYNLRAYASSIQATMLVVDSENDFQMKGQSRQLYEALLCPKEYMLFTAAEGAGAHCQAGAYDLSSARILDWLDQTFHAA
jgi:pimeloyl-ACP methyl ester carboxylesterase